MKAAVQATGHLSTNVKRICHVTGRACRRPACESSCEIQSAFQNEGWIDVEELSLRSPNSKPEGVTKPALAHKRRDPNAYAGNYEVKRTFHRRRLPVEEGLVPFNSQEGRKLFASALQTGGLEGSYWSLSENYMTQSDPSYCGLTALSMVLNSLNVDPGRRWKGAWRWYNEEEFDCGCVPEDRPKDQGVTLRELAYLASCNGQDVKRRHADPKVPIYGSTLAEFRETVKRMCGEASRGSRMIVQFDRVVLGQTGAGHFSPIGGYDEASDMVLVMEVARFKYFQFWCPVSLLYDAMNAVDEDTTLSRGWLEVSLQNGEGTTEAATLGSMEEQRMEEHQKAPMFKMCWGDAVANLVAGLKQVQDVSSPPTRCEGRELDLPPLPERRPPLSPAVHPETLTLDETEIYFPHTENHRGERTTSLPPPMFLDLGTLVDSRGHASGETVRLSDGDLIDIGLESCPAEMLTTPPDPGCSCEALVQHLFTHGMRGGRVAVRPVYDPGGLSLDQIRSINEALRNTRIHEFLAKRLPANSTPLATMLTLGMLRSQEASEYLLPSWFYCHLQPLAENDFSGLPKHVVAELENISRLVRLSVHV